MISNILPRFYESQYRLDKRASLFAEGSASSHNLTKFLLLLCLQGMHTKRNDFGKADNSISVLNDSRRVNCVRGMVVNAVFCFQSVIVFGYLHVRSCVLSPS